MKDKKLMAIIAVIVLLIIGLSIAKSKGPKPVDWKPNFINTKTSPYGTYITYELLGDIFEKKNIRSTRMPIYNNLKKGLDEYFEYPDEEYYNDYTASNTQEAIIKQDYTEEPLDIESLERDDDNPADWYLDMENMADTSSYIFINLQFNLDELDLEYLLDFVGLGNNVFISAEDFSRNFKDTLGIKVHSGYSKRDTTYTLVDYPSAKYNFRNIYGSPRLNTDSCKHPVRLLATNGLNDTVFIKIRYGKGDIYLHTIPTAFANVNMLQIEKYDFAFRCLSYLPENNKIIWDEYQKQGSIGGESTFRVLLNNPPLRVALYIILGGFLLFMIFRAKRTQRIIPVINPPVNSSLEFLGTISNLYYRKKDFQTIAEKRHAYFLDFIRKHYYMSTENINKEFIEVLSAKTGVEREVLNNIFILYQDIHSLAYIQNEKFLRYNSLLEDFYRTVKNK